MSFEFAKHFSKHLSRFFSHFRYPASLPSDVAEDLGLNLPKAPSFTKWIETLSQSHLVLQKLYKYMPKEEAENAFTHALKKESFRTTTLFSYFFQEGWLVITLHFDTQEKLRRIYIQAPSGLREGFDLAIVEKRPFP